MEIFQYISQGFAVSLLPYNLLLCFIGCLTGTLVGVLPGLGPSATIALLMPSTFGLNPASALIMLSGIYYGAMYGGSTTSILVNIPGESASVVTCIDGYQMARQGRAGPALGISAFGSFFAGTISVVGLMLFSPVLAKGALAFGPPEYFSLMCLGLTLLTYIGSQSTAKAILMVAVGIVLGIIGADTITGIRRFTFGIPELTDGIGLIPLIMGLFGISEVLTNLEAKVKVELYVSKVKNLLPNREDWKQSYKPILRGSLLGFFLGILPGSGGTIASFVSYGVEKRVSKHPERFGKGAIEGVAGPESANNSAAGGSFIPLFSLGIPSNPAIAMLFGALLIHGIVPGPKMIQETPDIFWGVVCSMYIGNLMLLVLNLPLIGIWVRLLQIPYKFFFPFILLFCLIGAYTVNYSPFDIYIMILFGIAGYLLKKFRYEPAPLVMAYVLGPMLEDSLKQSLIVSVGNPMIFVTRPVSVVLLILTVCMLISSFVRRKKPEWGEANAL